MAPRLASNFTQAFWVPGFQACTTSAPLIRVFVLGENLGLGLERDG
jgi:hypothetical protein